VLKSIEIGGTYEPTVAARKEREEIGKLLTFQGRKFTIPAIPQIDLHHDLGDGLRIVAAASSKKPILSRSLATDGAFG
jgi:hypothetical protein